VPENPRLEELRRRVQADPASIAFAALAEEFRRTGRFSDAIETCRMGLQRHPAYLSARVTLGRALIEVGDYDAAREELETVLRSAPENLAATRGLEQINERLGHSTEMHPDLHEIAREPIRLATERPPALPPPAEPPPSIDVMLATRPALTAPEPEATADEPEDAAAGEPFDIFGAALQAPPPPTPVRTFEASTPTFDAPAVPAERAPDPHVAAVLSRLERFLGAIESARHA
jgi:tetratricopeptide (TPR) repeat protein